MAKWSELEAQGVMRCCACFKDGTRCARRVKEPFDSFCAKHGPMFSAIAAREARIIKQQLRCDNAE